MKQIFFLSGLARSGSTLLGSILSQNPDIHVTPTSPMLDLLCFTNQALNTVEEQYTYDHKTVSDNIYNGLIESFYKNIDKPIIIDKHRGWPKNVVPASQFITPNPKIICTNRPVAEVLTSFIVLIEKNKQKDNFVDNALRKKQLPINNQNRARVLWEDYFSDPFRSMNYGLKNHRENLHMVEYHDLISKPDEVLSGIYKFLDLPEHNHNFNKIDNACAELKDSAWGLDNLHNIRPKLEKKSVPPEEVIGKELTLLFSQYDLKY